MRALLLTTLLAFPACRDSDFTREGTWQATGVNDRNLRAMLAYPSHAAGGAVAPYERGAAGTAPLGRLMRGERLPLPPSGPGPAAASISPGSANGH